MIGLRLGLGGRVIIRWGGSNGVGGRRDARCRVDYRSTCYSRRFTGVLKLLTMDLASLNLSSLSSS